MNWFKQKSDGLAPHVQREVQRILAAYPDVIGTS